MCLQICVESTLDFSFLFCYVKSFKYIGMYNSITNNKLFKWFYFMAKVINTYHAYAKFNIKDVNNFRSRRFIRTVCQQVEFDIRLVIYLWKNEKFFCHMVWIKLCMEKCTPEKKHTHSVVLKMNVLTQNSIFTINSTSSTLNQTHDSYFPFDRCEFIIII